MSMHRAKLRDVWTWEPEGWPAGLVTGSVNGDRVNIEHVVLFRGRSPRDIFPMLREGIEDATKAGIAVLTFCIPDEHVLAPRLKKLAARYGFEAYSPGWFMRWL